MNINLHPAVQIWLNSIPRNQQGAAISNMVMNAMKIPDLEARVQRSEREIERLKNIVEDMNN